MSAISLPAVRCVRPTRLERLALRAVAAVDGLVARRMTRRAARLGLRGAQDAAVEARRDVAAAYALGLHRR